MSATLNHVGKYELRSIIARTAASIVYDGWDADIDRQVAIKIIPLPTIQDEEAKEALVRFKRGAKAAGKLTHPNIVGVYDYGETDRYAYIVMEYINGSTLKQVFDSGQAFDIPMVQRVMGEILDGLQYSHDHGIVHRDMKPANIMFTRNQRTKITDFGIARIEDSNLTQVGTVIGTPAYMSPEQFMGEDVDWRTDIYSTGVILYNMVTGARPYQGTFTTIMNKVLNTPAPRPSEVLPSISPALDEIVARAMAKPREHRFQSAAEFNTALQSLQLETRPPVRPPAPLRVESSDAFRPPRLQRTSQTAWIAGGAAVALIAAGVGVGLYRHHAGSSASLAAAERPSPHPVTSLAATPAPSPVTPVTAPSAKPPAAAPPVLAATPQVDTAPPAPARTEPEPTPAQPQMAAAAVTPLTPPPLAIPEPVRPAEPARRLDSPPPQRADVPAPALIPTQTSAQAPPARDTRRVQPTRAVSSPKSDFDDVQEALNSLRFQNQADKPSEPQPSLPAYPVTSLNGTLGLFCQSVTPDRAGSLGLDSAKGWLVLGVTAGSPAEHAGIRANDVILKVNGAPVQSISGLRASPGKAISFDVFRDRKVVPLVLR